MQRKTIPFSTLLTLLILLALVISACATNLEKPEAGKSEAEKSPAATSAPAYGSCGLSLAEDVSDNDAIHAVVNAEGQFVVKQDIDALMALWADGSYIKNAKNSVADESDDQVWNDVDAIRHRYVRTVFPGAPAEIQPADLEIQINDGNAVVIATTHIGDEVSPSGDRWELQQQAGCWVIQSLAYNLEPK